MTQNQTTPTQPNHIVAIQRVEEAIRQLKDNESVLNFFVVDCNNTPNGDMFYIYHLAKTLHEKGFKVQMLYQLENEYTDGELYQLERKNQAINPERVFGGVGQWLGEDYANLPHLNISTQDWSVKPSDFLFIPEALSSFMVQTFKHKLPCKRYVLVHNFDYVTDFIPFGSEWKHYGIFDAVVNTKRQEKLIKSVFPYINTTVLPPCILPVFRKPVEPKKLVVNIVAKHQSDVNKIIKQFYWKYPVYKFISFRDIRLFSTEKLAEMLKEAPITVWVDDNSPFGYTALAAMRSGSFLIGKIPQVMPDWITNEDGSIKNNAIWVYDTNVIPDMLNKAITCWLNGKEEEFSTPDIDATNKLYTPEIWSENVEKFIRNVFQTRIDEFSDVLTTLKARQNSNNNKIDTENE